MRSVLAHAETLREVRLEMTFPAYRRRVHAAPVFLRAERAHAVRSPRREADRAKRTLCARHEADRAKRTLCAMHVYARPGRGQPKITSFDNPAAKMRQ
jgi:hypothetical protein